MKIIIFSLTLILFSSSTLANFGVMIAGGNLSAGDLKTTASRHALFWAFDNKWFEKEENYLTWQLELASSHWNNEYFPDINAVSLTPVFHYVWSKKHYSIFAGGGIGATKLSGDRLSSRKLGSEWLFEDKFVLGTEILEHHRLTISFNHYSNANFASKNDGLSIWYLNYSYLW
ncbi:MAG: acyloxyacyl hydrolase [Colwellia sp.]|nr:acyloxyacyl hydrolase [Colwellia sp.]